MKELGVTASVDDLEIESFRSITRVSDFVTKRVAIESGLPNQAVASEFGTI